MDKSLSSQKTYMPYNCLKGVAFKDIEHVGRQTEVPTPFFVKFQIKDTKNKKKKDAYLLTGIARIDISFHEMYCVLFLGGEIIKTELDEKEQNQNYQINERVKRIKKRIFTKEYAHFMLKALDYLYGSDLKDDEIKIMEECFGKLSKQKTNIQNQQQENISLGKIQEKKEFEIKYKMKQMLHRQLFNKLKQCRQDPKLIQNLKSLDYQKMIQQNKSTEPQQQRASYARHFNQVIKSFKFKTRQERQDSLKDIEGISMVKPINTSDESQVYCLIIKENQKYNKQENGYSHLCSLEDIIFNKKQEKLQNDEIQSKSIENLMDMLLCKLFDNTKIIKKSIALSKQSDLACYNPSNIIFDTKIKQFFVCEEYKILKALNLESKPMSLQQLFVFCTPKSDWDIWTLIDDFSFLPNGVLNQFLEILPDKNSNQSLSQSFKTPPQSIYVKVCLLKFVLIWFELQTNMSFIDENLSKNEAKTQLILLIQYIGNYSVQNSNQSIHHPYQKVENLKKLAQKYLSMRENMEIKTIQKLKLRQEESQSKNMSSYNGKQYIKTLKVIRDSLKKITSRRHPQFSINQMENLLFYIDYFCFLTQIEHCLIINGQNESSKSKGHIYQPYIREIIQETLKMFQIPKISKMNKTYLQSDKQTNQIHNFIQTYFSKPLNYELIDYLSNLGNKFKDFKDQLTDQKCKIEQFIKKEYIQNLVVLQDPEQKIFHYFLSILLEVKLTSINQLQSQIKSQSQNLGKLIN